jgi:hypothetical protein
MHSFRKVIIDATPHSKYGYLEAVTLNRDIFFVRRKPFMTPFILFMNKSGMGIN